MWQLLALKWLHYGGAENAAPERHRNDLIDVTFATYATYFDGFLSSDKMANALFTEGSLMLKALSSQLQKPK